MLGGASPFAASASAFVVGFEIFAYDDSQFAVKEEACLKYFGYRVFIAA